MLDGELTFEVIENNKYGHNLDSEEKVRRKTILKLTRDHSV